MKKNIYSTKLKIILFLFFLISLISIYASLKFISDKTILIKQIIFFILGIIILIFSYYKKDDIFKYHLLTYFSLCFLLFLLLILGIKINGSRCWIIIGPLSIQPSEFMKVSLIITISKILDKNKRSIKKDFTLIIKILTILLIPSILTFLEPDTGVVIIYFVITICLLLYRGINTKYYIIISIMIIIFFSSITYLYFFNKELLLNIIGNNIYYRLDRLLNWSQGSGYQLENSLIAISSAGLFGFGFNKTPLYFPEANTDFIFTTYASNYGLFGSIILIILFIVFDLNIISIINNKTNRVNKYFLVGVFIMILYQQIQNISMTIGLLPITGITLPFISYGGSSLLSYMFICGIVLKIANEQYNSIN